MSDRPKLHPNVNLEFVRKEAKSLLKSCRSQDAAALARVRAQLERLKELDDNHAAGSLRLADIQYALARESGFPSWAELKKHDTGLNAPDFSHSGSDGMVLASGADPWRASVTYTVRPQLHPTLTHGQKYRISVSVMRRMPGAEEFGGYADLYCRAMAIANGRVAQLRSVAEGTALHSWILVHGWFTGEKIRAASAFVTLGVVCLRDGEEPPEGERAPLPDELAAAGGATPLNYKPEDVAANQRIDEGYRYVDLRDESVPRSDIFLISYAEYVSSSEGINYQPFVERAESLAKFHVPFLERQPSAKGAAKIVRREWFCATNPDIAVVHVYLRV